jgi:hypothetical protein
MTPPDSAIPTLERPAFFPGERLLAGDLSAVQSYQRTLRWLHNRALHDWGVALGLRVSGVRGDKTVRVTAGLALDRAGREILLPAALELQVPAVAGTSAGAPTDFYVTASWLDDTALTPEVRGGDCETEGAVRLGETCAVRFQHPASFAGTDWVYGSDLVLASIAVRDCKLASAVTTADRREIAPPTPYLGAGSTMPGDTPWELWRNPSNVVIGVRTTVSTAEAGFTTTPRYEARIGGGADFGAGPGAVHVAGYVQIVDPTPHSFVCAVVLPRGTVGAVPLNPPNPVLTDNFMRTLTDNLQWHVVWMGVEG